MNENFGNKNMADTMQTNVSKDVVESIQSDLENLKIYILQGRFKMSNDEAKIVNAVESEVSGVMKRQSREFDKMLADLSERLTAFEKRAEALGEVSGVEGIRAEVTELREELTNFAIGMEAKIDGLQGGLFKAIYEVKQQITSAPKSDPVTDKNDYSALCDRIERLERGSEVTFAEMSDKLDELLPAVKNRDGGINYDDIATAVATAVSAQVAASLNAVEDKLELAASEISVLKAEVNGLRAERGESAEDKAQEQIMSTLERLTGNIDKLKNEDGERVDAILSELKEFKSRLAKMDGAEADESLSNSFMSLKKELESISKLVDDEDKLEEKLHVDYEVLPSAIKQVSSDIENNLNDILSMEVENSIDNIIDDVTSDLNRDKAEREESEGAAPEATEEAPIEETTIEETAEEAPIENVLEEAPIEDAAQEEAIPEATDEEPIAEEPTEDATINEEQEEASREENETDDEEEADSFEEEMQGTPFDKNVEEEIAGDEETDDGYYPDETPGDEAYNEDWSKIKI